MNSKQAKHHHGSYLNKYDIKIHKEDKPGTVFLRTGGKVL